MSRAESLGDRADEDAMNTKEVEDRGEIGRPIGTYGVIRVPDVTNKGGSNPARSARRSLRIMELVHSAHRREGRTGAVALSTSRKED